MKRSFFGISPLWLPVVITALFLTKSSAGAGAAPAMYFHWEGGLSAYKYVTVEIAPNGRVSCDIDYLGKRTQSTFMLTSEEQAYFREQSKRVMALERKAIEKMAKDTGVTTWRMTEGGRTRELSYVYTQNPWINELTEAMWRIVRRETIAGRLEQGQAEEQYQAANDAWSDLRQGKVFRPEGLRKPLLVAAGKWPLPGLSFDRSRDTIGKLLQALTYCEPSEQWAGDVTQLYMSKPKGARIIMLRAMASGNFLSDLKDRQGRLLIPVMLEGLSELLADASLAKSQAARRACWEVVIALGNLRDRRAVELLASDKLWRVQSELHIASTAARSLTQIGLEGVEALLEKAKSADPQIREVAEGALYYAAESYAFPIGGERIDFGKVAEMRRFLAARGYGATGVDGFSLPREAAAALTAAMPGWRIMESSEFFAYARDRVSTHPDDRAGPQRCRGDFDGNGLKDIGLLLRKEDDVRLVALRQLPRDQWTVDDITTFPYAAGNQQGYDNFTFYLTTARPATVSFWTPEGAAKTGRLELKNDGIELNYEGKASVLYYWNGKGYSKAQGGDR